MNHLAQIRIDITPPGGRTIGAAGAASGTTLTVFLGGTIGALTIIAAIWFLFKIVLGGIAIINSDGDAKAVETARGSITYGAIGIGVIISATFVVGLVGFIFGVENMLDLNSWINTLSTTR